MQDTHRFSKQTISKQVVIMRRTHISTARSGYKLARPIWTETGSILLGVGVELNDRYLERLKQMGIDYIYVEDQRTSDIIPEDVLRDETRQKSVETVHRTMTSLMSEASGKKNMFVKDMGSTFRSLFTSILTELPNRGDIVVNLVNLHVKDGYLFHHAVNVAVLAGVLGIAKGYNKNQLLDLGVGAMLFDVGMTVFPDKLWQVSADLSAEQRSRIQKHTEEGYHLLRREFDVSLLSAHCALQHHERFDGSGYPRGLKGGEIHEYAQIVAIADVYDALTSPRPYRKRYSPSEAIEFLYANGNQWFDLELIKLFCKYIAIYPLSSTVRLNTGQLGVVSYVDPMVINRPVIRIIEEADGRETAPAYEVDLRQHVNITIVQTL